MHEFLAAIGLPLVQCRQKYNSMDSSVRGEVKTMISEGGVKGGFRTPHYGRKQSRIQTEILGHSLVRSLAPLIRGNVAIYSVFFPFSTIVQRANFLKPNRLFPWQIRWHALDSSLASYNF